MASSELKAYQTLPSIAFNLGGSVVAVLLGIDVLDQERTLGVALIFAGGVAAALGILGIVLRAASPRPRGG
jgi:sugar phosphate permease